jgi:hypothetical protein
MNVRNLLTLAASRRICEFHPIPYISRMASYKVDLRLHAFLGVGLCGWTTEEEGTTFRRNVGRLSAKNTTFFSAMFVVLLAAVPIFLV